MLGHMRGVYVDAAARVAYIDGAHQAQPAHQAEPLSHQRHMQAVPCWEMWMQKRPCTAWQCPWVMCAPALADRKHRSWHDKSKLTAASQHTHPMS